MQDLLEPKLVSLVDGDEKQFIVMLRTGQAILQADEIRNSQILIVREQGIGAVIFRHIEL
jgi:hypothetical protein